MSRNRLPLGLAILLFGVPGLAAPPDAHAPVPPAAGRTLSIHLQWGGALPLPAGALIACRARVVPLAPGGGTTQPAEASVQVPGPAGQCAIEIPLAWRGGGVPASATVLYQMEATTPAGKVVRTGSKAIMFPSLPDPGLQLTVRM